MADRMNRRRFLVVATVGGSVLLGAACQPAQSSLPAQSAPASGGVPKASGTINFYSQGDTNVQDLHTKQIVPAFEKATGAKVTFTFDQSGTGKQGIYDRLVAQKQTNKATWDIDLWETDNAYYTRPEDLFMAVTEKEVPNLKNVPQVVRDFVSNKAVPYRASSVVLAYNADQVKEPPKTFDELLQWVKANPGKFTYNEPTTGGSGDAFVISMIYKYSDYNKYIGKPFSAENEKDWDAAFRDLKELAPSLYQKGVNPKGNAGTIDLLNRGEIWMGPVWSDQVTTAIDEGRLPKAIKVTQIDPAFNGGAAYIGVTANAANKPTAFAYLNYLLEPEQQQLIVTGKMAGFPGVDWKVLPAEARNRFLGADKEYRLWPGGQYGTDMGRLWREKVAA